MASSVPFDGAPKVGGLSQQQQFETKLEHSRAETHRQLQKQSDGSHLSTGVPYELTDDFFKDQDVAYGDTNHIKAILEAIEGEAIETFTAHLSEDFFEKVVYNPNTNKYETRLYKEVSYEIHLKNGDNIHLNAKVNTNAVLPANPQDITGIEQAKIAANRLALIFVHIVQSAFDPRLDVPYRDKLIKDLAKETFLSLIASISPYDTNDTPRILGGVVDVIFLRHEKKSTLRVPLRNLSYQVSRTAKGIICGNLKIKKASASILFRQSMATLQECASQTSGRLINPRQESSPYAESATEMEVFQALEKMDKKQFTKHAHLNATQKERYIKYLHAKAEFIGKGLKSQEYHLDVSNVSAKPKASGEWVAGAAQFLDNSADRAVHSLLAFKEQCRGLELLRDQLSILAPSTVNTISKKIQELEGIIKNAEKAVKAVLQADPFKAPGSSYAKISGRASELLRRGDALIGAMDQAAVSLSQHKKQIEPGQPKAFAAYQQAVLAALSQANSKDGAKLFIKIDRLLAKMKQEQLSIQSKLAKESTNAALLEQAEELSLIEEKLSRCKAEFVEAQKRIAALAQEEYPSFRFSPEGPIHEGEERSIVKSFFKLQPALKIKLEKLPKIQAFFQQLSTLDQLPDDEMILPSAGIDKRAIASMLPAQETYGQDDESIVRYYFNQTARRNKHPTVHFLPPINLQAGSPPPKLDPASLLPGHRTLVSVQVENPKHWVLAQMTINKSGEPTVRILDPTKLSYPWSKFNPWGEAEPQAELINLQKLFSEMLKVPVKFDVVKITNKLEEDDKSAVVMPEKKPLRVTSQDSGILVCLYADSLLKPTSEFPEWVQIKAWAKAEMHMNLLNRIMREGQTERKVHAEREQKTAAASPTAPKKKEAPKAQSQGRRVGFKKPEVSLVSEPYPPEGYTTQSSKGQARATKFTPGVVDASALLGQVKKRRVGTVREAEIKAEFNRRILGEMGSIQGLGSAPLFPIRAALARNPINQDQLDMAEELFEIHAEEMLSMANVPAVEETALNSFTELFNKLMDLYLEETDEKKLKFLGNLLSTSLRKLAGSLINDPFRRDQTHACFLTNYERLEKVAQELLQQSTKAEGTEEAVAKLLKSKANRLIGIFYKMKEVKTEYFDKSNRAWRLSDITEAVAAFLEDASEEDRKFFDGLQIPVEIWKNYANLVPKKSQQVSAPALKTEKPQKDAEGEKAPVAYKKLKAAVLFDYVSSWPPKEQVRFSKMLQKIVYLAEHIAARSPLDEKPPAGDADKPQAAT